MPWKRKGGTVDFNSYSAIFKIEGDTLKVFPYYQEPAENLRQLLSVLGPHYSKIELFLIDKLNLQLNGVKLLETLIQKLYFRVIKSCWNHYYLCVGCSVCLKFGKIDQVCEKCLFYHLSGFISSPFFFSKGAKQKNVSRKNVHKASTASANHLSHQRHRRSISTTK